MSKSIRNAIFNWGMISLIFTIVLIAFLEIQGETRFLATRYDCAGMEHFVSPDWHIKGNNGLFLYAEASDPQYLNPYGYLNVNSLNRINRHNDLDYMWQKINNYFNAHLFRTDNEVLGLNIAQIAQKHEGSTDWGESCVTVSGKQVFVSGTDKCNQFVADVLFEAGLPRPNVKDSNKIATASQLADAKVQVDGLSSPQPLSTAQAGDVIAQEHGLDAQENPDGHCGIVLNYGQVVSVNTNINGGTVTVSDWGFRNPMAKHNNGEKNGAKSSPPVIRHPEK